MEPEPTLSWNPIGDLRELLHYPFMVHAFQAGIIVAAMAALVGWYVVLRRQAFAGHTIAVMSFPGAAGAALAGVPAALGYYVACAGAALAVGSARAGAGARMRESATIGVVQAAGLALGFLLLSLYGGVLEGLESLLFGTFLGIDAAQVLTLLIVAAVTLLALGLLARPLLLASLEPDFARARGVPVRTLDVAFLLILGLAVAATSQITGALLVLALLVAPPAAAQALTGRPLLGALCSVAIGLLVICSALAIAYYSNCPLGFLVSSLALVAYLFARLAARLRGTRARP
jgi:zinc/manganese transport system permease protein